MSQQETATDSLISIIRSIQLAQENGVLIARRGEGGASEEGSIVFANGQVAQATAGRRTGSGALNRLSTWGKCTYTFTTSRGVVRPLPFTPSPNLDREQPAIADTHPGKQAPLVEKPADALNRPSGPLRTVRGQTFLFPSVVIILSPTQPMNEALRRIEQNELSRFHRQLFLLIDGQRSFEEVVRLVKKSQSDVYKLLCDLEGIGVIHIRR
ncbi:MAG TPA: hypothetical protein VF026_30180 [Ktedonobacteraceae bacterium]